MISGPETRRGVLAVLATLTVRPAWAEQDVTAPRWDIDALMARLRQVRAGSARFVERKYLAITTQPLASSGILRFTAPDRLERQTLLPQPSSLLIDGDRLTVQRPGESVRVVSLSDAPEIAALVSGLRATLAGDRATLERYFKLDLQGNVTAWQLALQPRDAHARALIAAIRIGGSFERIDRVDTLEADGDRTEMTIEAASAS